MNNLVNKLQAVKTVYSKDWSMVLKIVDSLNNNKAEVISKKWLNEYAKGYNLNLNDINTWSTYDGKCIFIEFYVFENKIFANCTIYDGRNYNGVRTTGRFYCKIKLNIEFITDLENKINYAFDEYCEDQYYKYKEEQKILWINKFKKKFNNE